MALAPTTSQRTAVASALRAFRRGRCPSLADYVRGPQAAREVPQRANVAAYAPTTRLKPSESPMETMLSFPLPSNRCDFEAMGRTGQQRPNTRLMLIAIFLLLSKSSFQLLGRLFPIGRLVTVDMVVPT